MLADAARVDAYARAIERCVRPGAAVLEIGTGTGLFAILAAKAGARRVYAIEADDIVEVARANARANGVERAIEFIHALSTQAELPERVDVVISDLRGVLPFYESHVESIVDARSRFLAEGGALIPAVDRVMLSCVEAPREHAEIVGPWEQAYAGLRMDAARDLVVNDWQKSVFEAGQLVSPPACCATLDYRVIADARMESHLAVRASRAARVHGLALWFETTLAEGIGFSCAPGAPGRATIYGQAFFPWPREVEVVAGDDIELDIAVRPVGGRHVWTWAAKVAGMAFAQSNFAAEPLSAAKLRMRSAAYVPSVSVDGQVDRAILSAMEEGLPLGEIATRLQSRFPGRFRRWEEALARAGDLSERYAR